MAKIWLEMKWQIVSLLILGTPSMFIVYIIFFEFVIPSNDFRKYLDKLRNYKKMNTNFKRTLVSLRKSEPPTKLYIPSTLNTDYLLWHTQLIVCGVVCYIMV